LLEKMRGRQERQKLLEGKKKQNNNRKREREREK
jgi:hypothetical protein